MCVRVHVHVYVTEKERVGVGWKGRRVRVKNWVLAVYVNDTT